MAARGAKGRTREKKEWQWVEGEGPGPGQKEGRRGLMAMRCDDGSRGKHVFCATAAGQTK